MQHILYKWIPFDTTLCDTRWLPYLIWHTNINTVTWKTKNYQNLIKKSYNRKGKIDTSNTQIPNILAKKVSNHGIVSKYIQAKFEY
jgi:hypothetical protein